MVIPEREAKKKACPESADEQGHFRKCLGSGCMAWVRANPKGTRGTCGKALPVLINLPEYEQLLP